mmetsp:Transcript_38694/g.34400  ORF Transcript_38694/g.34400 Transcript_38694/m.34400 type:complete len:183 (-) Transcript_38694:800-1348(-)
MKSCDYLIKNMKHEEKLNRMFNTYKVFGIIADRAKLWEYCSFYISIVLNFIVLFSYFDGSPDRLEEPYLFFNLDFTETKSIINLLGVLNLVFSGLVVAHFFMKRAPILLGDIWSKFYKMKLNLMWTPLSFVAAVVISFYKCLRDIDILFNCLVILFAILGLALHPFFFFFGLTDMMRNDVLK